MSIGREWLEELSENCRSIKIKDKDIFFRLPDDEQRKALNEHIKFTVEQRKAYKDNGAFGWLEKFFVLCCRTTVSSPEFEDFTDAEWTRLIVVTREEGRIFSPILEMAMDLCGFPKSDDIVETKLLEEDHVAKADEEIGDTPTS